ncbi:1,2-phenylacetyl-CoA epoxidase subunit PaaB [Paenarthrobacter sp. TAF1]|uniref:1,2-phenylacetyl-CoA epoxidase subunit PaaB n=1 Tax=Paenarthrobacter sp. TAF1 TaxID=3233067 RepID=UPI003D41FE14
MAPHGNPEEPASAAGEIKREAPKVAATNAESTTTAHAARPAGTPGGAKEEHPWSLWEVFVRSSRGLSHVHAGSLHAPDAAMALRNARDLYTRRNEGVSIWVVPAEAISSSDPDAKGAFFESPQGKDYRHATYYTKSEGVKHL